MDHLRRLEAFVRVAELSSFSAAGRDLGCAQSQVSRAVRELEEDVGCALFLRSTRRVILTAEGTKYLDGVRRALRELGDADEAARATHGEVRGTLRVTAPVAFGDTLAPVLAALVSRHPVLSIEALLTDRAIDVVEEGFDVAIRSGPLRPSTLRVRRLGAVHSVLVAAPSYLGARGTPRNVADLSAHDHVLFTAKPGARRLTVVDARNRAATVHITARLHTNELRFANLAALAGAGIAAIPLPLARPALDAGTLVRVLPGHTLRAAPIHVLFPPRPSQPARVVAFIDAIAEAISASRSLGAA